MRSHRTIVALVAAVLAIAAAASATGQETVTHREPLRARTALRRVVAAHRTAYGLRVRVTRVARERGW